MRPTNVLATFLPLSAVSALPWFDSEPVLESRSDCATDKRTYVRRYCKNINTGFKRSYAPCGGHVECHIFGSECVADWCGQACNPNETFMSEVDSQPAATEAPSTMGSSTICIPTSTAPSSIAPSSTASTPASSTAIGPTTTASPTASHASIAATSMTAFATATAL